MTAKTNYNDSLKQSEKNILEQNVIKDKDTPDRTIENKYVHTTHHDSFYSWLVMICSFLANGILTSHGVGSGLYLVEWTETFNVSRATLGWLPSLQAFTFSITAMFSGVIIDKYGGMQICFIGALIQTCGLILSAFAPSLWFLRISYGIITGIGIGIEQLVPIVVLPQYFKKYQNFASGISLMGFSACAFVMVYILHILIEKYTWRGAMLIHAGIVLHLCVFSFFFDSYNKHYNIKQTSADTTATKSKDNSKSAFVNGIVKYLKSFKISMFKDVAFVLNLLYTCFMSVGLEVAYKLTPSMAVSIGLTKDQAAFIPFYISVASTVARVFGSVLANIQCTNVILVGSVSTIIGGTAVAVYVTAVEFLPLVLLSLVYGASLGMMHTVSISKDIKLFGLSRLGAVQSWITAIKSFVVLGILPFAGFTYDVTESYNFAFVFAGCVQVFGGILAIATAYIHYRRNNTEEAIDKKDEELNHPLNIYDKSTNKHLNLDDPSILYASSGSLHIM